MRDPTFPDLRGLRCDEVWTLTWEGSLSQDDADTAIDGPAVRESQMLVDGFGAHIVDQSKPFCDAGVEPYDIVQLRGCDPSLGDADCALGYTCFVHPQSQVAGLGACMLKDEADRLANACKPFLTSLRRYTVGKSTSGELDLLPRKHVLRTTPVDGCTDDAQCQTLANYAARLDELAEPGRRHDADRIRTRGRAASIRIAAPIARHRQALHRDVHRPTRTATTARSATAARAWRASMPPQACVNARQRYELRAREAFTVIGTRSGYVHPIIADASGKLREGSEREPVPGRPHPAEPRRRAIRPRTRAPARCPAAASSRTRASRPSTRPSTSRTTRTSQAARARSARRRRTSSRAPPTRSCSATAA